MRKLFEWGGIIAGVILIAFGAGALYISVQARSEVQDNLTAEQITGTPDMTPSAISAEAQKAGLKNISLPSCSVAGDQVTSGSTARCFAQYMRVHALEASGGLTYSQMPRYATADGKGTNDPAQAQKGPNGQPLDNAARNLWVTATALTTALNVAYMGEQLSLFGIVVGIALLLTGIGFIVLALLGALRLREAAEEPPAMTAPAAAGD